MGGKGLNIGSRGRVLGGKGAYLELTQTRSWDNLAHGTISGHVLILLLSSLGGDLHVERSSILCGLGTLECLLFSSIELVLT